MRRELLAFVERTGADELIVSTTTYEAEARERSLRLTMEALKPHVPA